MYKEYTVITTFVTLDIYDFCILEGVNENIPDFKTFRNSLVSTYQIALGNFDLKYIFSSSY